MVFVRVFCPGPHSAEHAPHSLQFGDSWHATGEGGGGGGGLGDIEGPGENPDGEGPGERVGEGPGDKVGEPLTQVDQLLKEFKTNVFDMMLEGLHTVNPPARVPALVPDGHNPELIAKDPF